LLDDLLSFFLSARFLVSTHSQGIIEEIAVSRDSTTVKDTYDLFALDEFISGSGARYKADSSH
jgi:hypothetical protein